MKGKIVSVVIYWIRRPTNPMSFPAGNFVYFHREDGSFTNYDPTVASWNRLARLLGIQPDIADRGMSYIAWERPGYVPPEASWAGVTREDDTTQKGGEME